MAYLTCSKRPGGSRAAGLVSDAPSPAPLDDGCMAGTPPKAEPALARDAFSMEATPCGDTCSIGTQITGRQLCLQILGSFQHVARHALPQVASGPVQNMTSSYSLSIDACLTASLAKKEHRAPSWKCRWMQQHTSAAICSLRHLAR